MPVVGIKLTRYYFLSLNISSDRKTGIDTIKT